MASRQRVDLDPELISDAHNNISRIRQSLQNCGSESVRRRVRALLYRCLIGRRGSPARYPGVHEDRKAGWMARRPRLSPCAGRTRRLDGTGSAGRVPRRILAGKKSFIATFSCRSGERRPCAGRCALDRLCLKFAGKHRSRTHLTSGAALRPRITVAETASVASSRTIRSTA